MTLLQYQHSLYWSPGALGSRIWKDGAKLSIYESKMGRLFLYNMRMMHINAHLMRISRYIRMANPTQDPFYSISGKIWNALLPQSK